MGDITVFHSKLQLHLCNYVGKPGSGSTQEKTFCSTLNGQPASVVESHSSGSLYYAAVSSILPGGPNSSIWPLRTPNTKDDI